MGGPIGGVISSVAEGVDALGKSIKNAAEGDWGEAGEQFAQFGLEAAGIAGAALAGPAAEPIQEGIEGVLESVGLEQKGTGDVPAPGGNGANFDLPGMFSGVAEGVLGGLSGTGEAGGALGKILGAVGGGAGSGGGGPDDLFGGVLEGDQIGAFTSQLGDFGEAAGTLEKLGEGSSEVADEVLSAAT